MLPINLLNALKQYTLDQQLPTGAADAQSKSAPQFELGQKVQGTIQAQVKPNVYQVTVAGQLMQMQLPATLKSGDTVALQVISLQPRLAFSMAGSSEPIPTQEQLGSAAKILSALSQQPPVKAYVRAIQSAPLWETPQPPQSSQLAGMLRDALGKSGLFYESHQALWLEGQHSTAQLLLEPQNQPPEQARAATATGIQVIAADNVNKQIIAADTAKLTTDTVNLSTSQAAQPEDASAAGQTKILSSDDRAQAIPSHLQPLVQQQLNALETSQMLWQGNVWPGQEMQWEIHEQAPQNPSATEQRQWITQVRLNLPKLGEVTATLRLNSAGLGITLNAGHPQTRAVMGSASTQLVSALSDAGIPVVSTQIAQ